MQTEIKMRPDAITTLTMKNDKLQKENEKLRAQVTLLAQEIESLHQQIKRE